MNKEEAEFFVDALLEFTKVELIEWVRNHFFPTKKLTKKEALVVLLKIGRLCSDQLKKEEGGEG